MIIQTLMVENVDDSAEIELEVSHKMEIKPLLSLFAFY